MCLAVPGKIIQINDENAIIDYGKNIKRKANSSLIDCSVGDYVIVQAGFVFQKVSEKEAKNFEELF